MTDETRETAPPQILRLLDERVLERIVPDATMIVGLWTKAINSDLDARETSLSTDNRLGLAYQSGLQAVHALLQACGYRVRSTQSHHYYTFYAARALAEAASTGAIRQGSLDLDAHRSRRAAAIYDSEPATAKDLNDLLCILETVLPAIHAALKMLQPNQAKHFSSPGQRPM